MKVKWHNVCVLVFTILLAAVLPALAIVPRADKIGAMIAGGPLVVPVGTSSKNDLTPNVQQRIQYIYAYDATAPMDADITGIHAYTTHLDFPATCADITHESTPTTTTTLSPAANATRGIYTAMHYYVRFYKPSIGRWPSRDPIGEKSFFDQYLDNILHQKQSEGEKSGLHGWNLKVVLMKEMRRIKSEFLAASREPAYLFVRNNPLLYVDGMGLQGIIGGIVGGVRDAACWCCANSVGANVLLQLRIAGIDGGDNAGGGNAFRHCLASCQTVRACGATCSQSFWDGRETPGHPEDDQDLANNAVDRGIQGSCWDGCKNAWDNGQLNCQGNPCPPSPTPEPDIPSLSPDCIPLGYGLYYCPPILPF